MNCYGFSLFEIKDTTVYFEELKRDVLIFVPCLFHRNSPEKQLFSLFINLHSVFSTTHFSVLLNAGQTLPEKS